MRELRIRWILFRRGRRLEPWHLLVVGAAVMACWIAVAAYSSYRTDQSLRQQLVQLQSQTSALSGQVRAQRQEVSYSGTSAWQTEMVRADGLAPAGERTYVIETRAAAAGPGAAEQGASSLGAAVTSVARGMLSIG